MYVSDERFRRMSDSHLLGFVVIEEGCVIEANDAFLNAIGWARVDVEEGRIHWHQITPEEYGPVDHLNEARLVEEGSTIPYEKELLRKDATRISVLVGSVRLQVFPKLQWISFVLELGERQRSQERLVLRKKLEIIGYLTRGLAQRFNNALMVLLNSLSLALESSPHDSAARGFVSTAMQAADRIVELSRDLVNSSEKAGLNVDPVDVSLVVRNAESRIRASLPQRIRLTLELSDKLPLIQADASLVRDVLMNLVSNAIEAIGLDNDGTITLQTKTGIIEKESIENYISYESIRPGQYVFLEVRNSGYAIDENFKHRIFDPFFSTKDISRGLGLTIVLGILRSHAGGIRMTSGPDGTAFTACFPAMGE